VSFHAEWQASAMDKIAMTDFATAVGRLRGGLKFGPERDTIGMWARSS
jgi:hypothetical protein